MDDLLVPDIKRICQYSIDTDGVWVWPSSLAYYVARYHTELPGDFLRHMEATGWTPPALDADALDTEGHVRLEEKYEYGILLAKVERNAEGEVTDTMVSSRD